MVRRHRLRREGRHGVRRVARGRGSGADLDPPRPPQEGLRHRRAAQVALGGGVVSPPPPPWSSERRPPNPAERYCRTAITETLLRSASRLWPAGTDSPAS